MKNTLLLASLTVLASACATGPAPMMIDNAALPETVRAPAGARQTMWTVGRGEITYECREKKDMAGQYEWAFVAPVATLYAADQKPVGFPTDRPWLPAHRSIPGSVWMPGAGALSWSDTKYCAARAKYAYGLVVTMRAPV